MKWHVLVSLVVLAALPAAVSAQHLQTLQIGHIPQVADRAPTIWGMSGMEMLRITQSIGSVTPITRTLTFEARTVEILSRTQTPPLRSSDIRVVTNRGHDYIAVRRYMLLEVLPEDARAEHTTKTSLAHKWAARVRRVLPQVAPLPNRFGV